MLRLPGELISMIKDTGADISSIIDKAAHVESKYLKICGSIKSGKTEALIKRTRVLMEQGVDPKSICVIVNTANAVEAFRERLIALLGDSRFDLSKLTITTVQQLAIKALDCEEVRKTLNRVPRILTKYENTFVLQDLRASGFEAALIKRTLASLEQSWCTDSMPESFENDFKDKSQKDAATELKVFLKEYLTSLKAMLPEELSYLCLQFFRQNPKQTACLCFDHIMVDDFQNLSKSSQLICEALTRDSFTVAGNAESIIVNREAYPCLEGFTQFSLEHDAATTVTLDETESCENTEDQVDTSNSTTWPSPPVHQILNIKWRDPEDEINGISEWIKKLAYENNTPLSEFFLLVPNRHWARASERSLIEHDQNFVTLLSGQILLGDPRKQDHSSALIAFTRLGLLADPTDPIAWRCWCGFGLADLGAAAWKSLLGLAATENLTIVEALAQLVEPDYALEQSFSGFDHLYKRYQEGKAFIECNERKTGSSLIKAVAGEKPNKIFSLLIEPFESNEDARTVFQRVLKCALDPCFESSLDAVRIFSYGELTGLSPQMVVLTGFNDGFMPPNGYFDESLSESTRESIKHEHEALFKDALGKTSKTLLISTIQKTEEERAESLKLHIVRRKKEHDKMMAMLSPSLFLQEAGNLIPGSESGQQFLSSL